MSDMGVSTRSLMNDLGSIERWLSSVAREPLLAYRDILRLLQHQYKSPKIESKSIKPMLLETATIVVVFEEELEPEMASGAEVVVGGETMMTTVVVVKGVTVLADWVA